jgi:N-carbamoyl-L-amino-acid hydrolase
MPKRRNASLGMARVIELVHEVAMDYQPSAVGAVGHIQVYPNSRNIIAGKAVFTIDIRSPNKDVLDEMDERIRGGIENIAEGLDIGFEVEQVGHFDPVTFDKTLVGNVREAAKELGYSYRDIVSGAGHDACWINRVAPSAMIMCPCVDGLSHNEAEEISKEWAAAGTDVLLRAVLETAEIVS